MPSSVRFDETLSGTQVLGGGFSHRAGEGNIFQPLASDPSNVTLTVQGTIQRVGDTVNVSLNGPGTSVSGSAVYEGYYFVGSERIYVFHPSSEFPNSGIGFAITADGQPVPLTTGDIKLHTGTADPCFLRGTMLGTARGDVAVETLRAGDEVSVMVAGRAVSRPVTWVGSQRVSLHARHADADEFPVRIRAGAFRDEVPHRDLLVTSEHCVFVDGTLIPVRMLVNDRSITVARDVTEFEFFHVELEQHGILVAEGLETESYLDTGNRDRFVTVDAGSMSGRTVKSWARDAAAPLVVNRDRVEPIWCRLAARAEARGWVPVKAVQLDTEPQLRLVTDTGMEIAPSLVDGQSYAFLVPDGVEQIWLRSRTARPSETLGRFVDDRRELGVRVGQISMSAGRSRERYNAHLTAETLSGWHGLEAGATARWTNGDASLRLGGRQTRNQPMFLDIEVVAAGPYVRTENSHPA